MIYRRILSEEEKNNILNYLRIKWDIAYDYYWYPLYDTKIKDIMSLSLRIIDDGEVDLSNIIKNILFENSIDYLFEFVEYAGPNDDIEFETINLEVRYGPFERFWCDKTLEWLVYLTHEGYITFGGSMLISGVKKYIPVWEKYEYKV